MHVTTTAKIQGLPRVGPGIGKQPLLMTVFQMKHEIMGNI